MDYNSIAYFSRFVNNFLADFLHFEKIFVKNEKILKTY